MKNIVIFGAGQIAELAHFYISKLENIKICGFVVDDTFFKHSELLNLPIVRKSEFVKQFPPEKFEAFIALSYSNMNNDRKRVFLELKELGYTLYSYVSPHCTNFSSSIGENCFILEDNTLQPFTVIGNNVTLWSGNHVGHHSTIGDHAFITSHVVISGGVKIGEGTFIGVNATLRDHISIGENSFISAGCLITKDTVVGEIWKAPKSLKSESKSTSIKNP